MAWREQLTLAFMIAAPPSLTVKTQFAGTGRTNSGDNRNRMVTSVTVTMEFLSSSVGILPRETATALRSLCISTEDNP